MRGWAHAGGHGRGIWRSPRYWQASTGRRPALTAALTPSDLRVPTPARLTADTALTNAAISACDKGGRWQKVSRHGGVGGPPALLARLAHQRLLCSLRSCHFLRCLCYQLPTQGCPLSSDSCPPIALPRLRHTLPWFPSIRRPWKSSRAWSARACRVTPSPTQPPSPLWPRASNGTPPCSSSTTCRRGWAKRAPAALLWECFASGGCKSALSRASI